MGRHSAPESDAPEDDAPEDDAPGEDVARAGSYVRADRPTAPVSAPQSGTHADLQMLRENPALRARCIAAAVVPFILYTVVLVTIGRADIYLVWVWIPIVVAGILVGTFLDLGHRSARSEPR